tara:strand:- start:5490 stop:6608 length:1119 start_codon:yes stop_codon:yes gene_type:complete
MPRVGKKKFPYTKKGIAQAKAYAKKNDLPIIYEDAKAGMSVPSYAEGGGVRYYESQRAGASVTPYMPGGGGEGAGGMAAGAALGSALASRRGSSEEAEYAAPEGKTCPEGQVLDADGNCVVKWREEWEEGDNEGNKIEDFNPQVDPETGIGSDHVPEGDDGKDRRGVSEEHDRQRGTTRSYDEQGNMTRTNKQGNVVGGTKEQRIARNRTYAKDGQPITKDEFDKYKEQSVSAQANRKSERDQTPISLKERKVSSVGGGDKGGSALALGKPKGEGKGLGALAKNIGEKKGDGGGLGEKLKGDGGGLADKLKGDGDGPLAKIKEKAEEATAKKGAIVRPKRKSYKHGGKVKANKKGVAIIIAIGRPKVNRKKR